MTQNFAYRVATETTHKFNSKTPQEQLYTACKRMLKAIADGSDRDRAIVLAGTRANSRFVAFYSAYHECVRAGSGANDQERAEINNWKITA